MRLSILHKGLLLVVVPLIFEIVLVVFLFVVVRDAQTQLAERSRRLIELSAGGLAEAAAMEALLATMRADRDEQAAEQFRTAKKLYAEEIQKLADYQKQKPDAIKALDALVENSALALGLMDEIDEKIKSNTYTLADRIQFAQRGILLSRRFRGEVQELRKEHLQNYEQTKASQEKLQFQLTIYIVGGVVVSILIAIGMGFFFSRSIVQRLATVKKNTLLLAKEEPLVQHVAGDDELSELDQVLHSVANVIADARRRERAVVVNASDIICTIDKAGNFASMNPACTRLLGYEPEELIGKPSSSILPDGETLGELEKGAQSFEKGALSKQGLRKDMLWSVRWSDAEQSWFCVLHDVTERKQAERFAQRVRNMVSHDIRAPLSSIIGSLQLVAEGRVGAVSDDVIEVLSTAEDSAQRLMTLSKDLLQLEKLTSGRLELSIKPVPLSAVYEASVKSVSTLAKQSSVSFKIEPQDITVAADPDRLTQVMVNLFSNAIKFSPEGGTVTVSTTDEGSAVRIAVRDEGRGIPPEFLSRLFSPFEQASASDEFDLGGTGLGLSICREIVERHGGKISAESVGGRGSTFVVVLPKTASA